MSNFLHIMVPEKFIAPFINFVDENFGKENHHYVLITSEKYQYGLAKKHNVEFLYTDEDIFTTLHKYMQEATKIILHGLWRDKVDTLLLNNQDLLKKSYWVMWGGDFYFPEKQTENRKKVIKNIAYLVTGTAGEVQYVQEHYKAQGKHIKAFVYTSNLYKDVSCKHSSDSTVHILVGNSATKTNHHREVFELLLEHKESDIKIYVPLSYGDFQYGMTVMQKGYELFGNKFKPMLEFMDENMYNEFLSTIDIAIFNHDRQQGMGNIITLLGMGKKVYMRKSVSTYMMFIDNGIQVVDIARLDLKTYKKKINNKNIERVKHIFSSENFVKQLSQIF